MSYKLSKHISGRELIYRYVGSRSDRSCLPSKSLRRTFGHRGLTFSVNAGEIVGLLGPSGAGKTIILSILATLIAPDAGEVELPGSTRACLPVGRSLEVLESVGLRDRENDPVWTLSGGMSGVSIWPALWSVGPEPLLLDEPTVGVDPLSREGIFATIRSAADSGVAILYSTHYTEEVESICDRALLIDQGKCWPMVRSSS